jgi:Flp pilus assembly protein TadG
MTMRRWRHSEKGQATVEFALVVPILIWLLVGLVDVARMVNAVFIIQHSAREGVRLGVTGASDTEVVDRAVMVAATLDTSQLAVTVSPAAPRSTGSDIAVTVTYNYKVMALMGIIGTDVPLGTQLVARVE